MSWVLSRKAGATAIVVSATSPARALSGIAPTLQRALEDWSNVAPRPNALSDALNEGSADGVFDLDMAWPRLPRAYEFVDGSAYLPHVARVRRARGAEVPESFYVDPLMYQGVSAGFYGPRDPVKVVSEDYGIDLEAEIVIVTDDVPMAVTPDAGAQHIVLVGLINDVSLRNLIPANSRALRLPVVAPRSAEPGVRDPGRAFGAHWQGTSCTCRC
jgi:fumarylacetoacetate (FAA) hydrolase